jgi:type IV secretion system protein VirD4
MKFFSQSTELRQLAIEHVAVRSASEGAEYGAYLGRDARGQWCFAAPERSVMILGPPRSGKTSSLIIPNILAANGPVVSTSTKSDVLNCTSAIRSGIGRCWAFDPTHSTPSTGDLEPLRWSPLQSCGTWEGAMRTARSLVDVSSSTRSPRTEGSSHSHWNERAQSLLAPLLFSASLEGAEMRTVLAWVDRRKALPAQNILAGTPGSVAELADHALEGIVATDERELSGIWSTASGVLSGFRTERALRATDRPNFDPGAFVRSADTIYIAAGAQYQMQVAPMVVGLIEDVRAATYQRAESSRAPFSADGCRPGPPVLLALDEVANIAPLPALPSMISEGGGQGLTTLACLQDLSQARHRWHEEADGFPSLFGITVVLPGIGDVRTLEALSTLAGDEEIPTRSVSSGRTPTDHPFTDMVTGGRQHVGESASTHWRRRLPPDLIARGIPGHALAFDERNQVGSVPLTPAHASEPWRSLSMAPRNLGHERTEPPRREWDREQGRER